MIKELYKDRTREVKVNVVQNGVDSIRKKDILKSGCRVYDGGFLGVAGVLGEPTEATWSAAEKNLELKIPYSCEPSCGPARAESHGGAFEPELFVKDCERLLNELSSRYPRLIFSNKISAVETAESIKNDAGLDCSYRDLVYLVSLAVKHVDSTAIMDTGVGFETRGDFVAETLELCERTLAHFEKTCELPKSDRVMAVMFPEYAAMFMERSLDAEALKKGASMFSSKLGKKAFSDRFTVYADRTAERLGQPFFDAEGSTLNGDRIALIENGVLKRGFADKKRATMYETENTASGSGTYDNVPDSGTTRLSIESGDKTLAELIGGGEAIFIDTMSGGDATNEGQFASPVQMSYLMSGAEMVGRLPEFGISFSMFDAFGDGYVGVSSDKLGGSNLAVFYVNISK